MNLRETKIGKITIRLVISKNRFFFYLIKLIGIKLRIICSISLENLSINKQVGAWPKKYIGQRSFRFAKKKII